MLLAHRWWKRPSDDGPPALLLHGGTGSADTWWRVAPSLVAAGWNVLGLDLRGHGANDYAGGAYSVPELAADVAESVAALNVQPLDVVWGHSLGALTALALLASRSDIARLVILEEPADSRPAGWGFYAPHLRSEREAALGNPAAFVRGLLAASPRWTEADAASAFVGIASCDTESLARSCERGLEYNTLQLTRALRVPALLLLAPLDSGSVLLEPERGEVIATLTRDATVELEGGHVLHRDQFDETMRLVLRFLQAHAYVPPAGAGSRQLAAPDQVV